MKNLISIILTLGLGLALGIPVQPDVVRSGAIVIPSEGSKVLDRSGMMFSEKIFDFVLTNSGTSTDTVIGNVFDIRNLVLPRVYSVDTASAGTTLTALMDSLLGQATATCYDISDSSGQTDSVNFKFTIQGSDYASDPSDPNSAQSDSWYTIRTRTITDASASSAQVTQDTIKVFLPVATHSTQFIRVYGENLSTAAQNDQRCRVFLYRPKWFPIQRAH
jgi:hypothetical protein